VNAGGVRVYFGGTFDPPHLGHHVMLQQLLADSWVKAVHVVPTAKNPLKNAEHLGDLETRKTWMNVWLKEFSGNSKLHLETIEWDHENEGPQYTVDTLQQLKARYPEDQWVLCVGGDIPKDFHRWKDVERLLGGLHSVWVFARGAQTDPVVELRADLKSLAEFRIMTSSVPEVSSTEIRAACRNNALQNDWAALLLPSIKEKLTDLAGH
jgi:nicotinate (nicotinamide) nucleotide adenylyltransferase